MYAFDQSTIDALHMLGVEVTDVTYLSRRGQQDEADDADQDEAGKAWRTVEKAARPTIDKALHNLDTRIARLQAQVKRLSIPIEDQIIAILGLRSRDVRVVPTFCAPVADDAARPGAAALMETIEHLADQMTERYEV